MLSVYHILPDLAKSFDRKRFLTCGRALARPRAAHDRASLQADDQRDDHDAPDDGLGQDDAEIVQPGDEQHHRRQLAEGLAQAGHDGRDVVADALQGVAVDDDDHRDEIERGIDPQVQARGVDDLLPRAARDPQIGRAHV